MRLHDSYQAWAGNERGRFWREELKLELAYQDGHLRFFDPGAQAPIATRSEAAEWAEAELKRLSVALAQPRRGQA